MPQPNPIPLAQREPHSFGKTYTIRLRQHEGGLFPKLWEATLLDAKGKVIEILEDANALNYAMENIIGRIEQDGF